MKAEQATVDDESSWIVVTIPVVTDVENIDVIEMGDDTDETHVTVHALPKSLMLVSRNTATRHDSLHWLPFKHFMITHNELYYFSITNKETSIYPTLIQLRFFLE